MHIQSQEKLVTLLGSSYVSSVVINSIWLLSNVRHCSAEINIQRLRGKAIKPPLLLIH